MSFFRWGKKKEDSTQEEQIYKGELQALSAQRLEAILNYAADKIDQFGMIVPAILALEASRPVTLITSNMMWGIAPLFKLFTQDQFGHEIALALEDERNIDGLIEKLERRDEDNRARVKLQKQEKKRLAREKSKNMSAE